MYGIADSDLHIYLLYKTDKLITYRATGKSCKYRTGTLPDNVEFNVGRPSCGILRFNTYTTVDGLALTNMLFSSTTATTIHEFMHVLGFDASLYSTYLDPSTGNVYAGGVVSNITSSVHSSRTAVSGDSFVIHTPNVLQWTRDFFNCPALPGMLL